MQLNDHHYNVGDISVLDPAPRTISDLKAEILQIWSEILTEQCKNFAHSIAGRIEKFTASDGWYLE